MMPRQLTGRRLKRNHSNALPKIIIAYNVETERIETVAGGVRYSHRFRCGHAISGRYRDGGISNIVHNPIHEPADFWALVDSLTSPQHTTWIVSYKALDDMVYTGLPEQFEKAKLVIDWPRSKRTREDNQDDNPHAQGLCVLENPPTILACRNINTGGRLVVVDACNWFPLPLNDLADGCNLKRMRVDESTDNDSLVRKRCKRDCEIVLLSFAGLMAWVKKEDMGMFRYTAAAQSMAAFRHRFMDHDILIHDNADAKRLERKAYYGGRTEVFKLGSIQGSAHQLDVTGLFPACMRSIRVPILLHRSESNRRLSGTLPDIKWADSIAHVELRTDEPLYPFRDARGVLYPIGSFETYLAGPDLEAAFNAGRILAVGGWAEYKTDVIFTRFVDTLWQMRQEYKASGNGLYDLFTKRIMNSLYGKFGQKSPKWVNVPNTFAALPWSRWRERDWSTGRLIEHRSVGWQVQRQTEQEEIEGSFVAISAFVTAAARRRMDWYRYVAGTGSVYYQGVDSLIVTDDGLSRLDKAGCVAPNELGKLRLQLSFNTGEIYGCNDYIVGHKTVVSGRSFDTRMDEIGRCIQQRRSSVAYLFNGHSVDSTAEYAEPWERISDYWKGKPNPSGWVSPHVMTSTRENIEGVLANANNNQYSGNGPNSGQNVSELPNGEGFRLPTAGERRGQGIV